MLAEKNILITGGTGSFGQEFLQHVFSNNIPVGRITLLSRDELKHYNLQQQYNPKEYSNLQFMIGDIRDKERLQEAVQKQDIVIHAAAMKHVYLCEENPTECYKTNVQGAKNLIETIANTQVQQVVVISTDKAVNPANVYGKSKQKSEKLFLEANTQLKDIKISVVRYGNVLGTSGSVVPSFEKQKETGILKITDERMQRYFLSPTQAIEAVLYTIENQEGGEIIIPECEERKIIDLAKEICPTCEIEFTGIRNGEKLQESLFSEQERNKVIKDNNYYILR